MCGVVCSVITEQRARGCMCVYENATEHTHLSVEERRGRKLGDCRGEEPGRCSSQNCPPPVHHPLHRITPCLLQIEAGTEGEDYQIEIWER